MSSPYQLDMLKFRRQKYARKVRRKDAVANVKHHQLTPQKIKTLGPGVHTDGETLNLWVSDNLSKRWMQRVSINGRQRNLGLGGYPRVGLAEAREQTRDNLSIIRQGRDPLQEKRLARQQAKLQASLPKFRDFATFVVNDRHEGKLDGDSFKQWMRSLTKHAFPVIGDKRIDEIEEAQVKAMLRPIWLEFPETAKRVRQRTETVFDCARSEGWMAGKDNPAGKHILKALPPQPDNTENHLSLPYSEVSDAIATVWNSDADLVTKLGFEFLVLTGARTAEVRNAVWSEFDLDKRIRTIPAAKMKMKRDHTVPLLDRVLEILDEARTLTDGEGLVFPNERERMKGILKPMSKSVFLVRLNDLKIEAVPHGFRASFRTWAEEQQPHSEAAAELALAHGKKTKVVQAYARSGLLETRRRLMRNWEHYLKTGEVLPFEWVTSDLKPLPGQHLLAA